MRTESVAPNGRSHAWGALARYLPANRRSSDAGAFWARHRSSVLLGSALLFLPPLAVIFQLAGDANFCGRFCPRMFFVWHEGASVSSFLVGFARSYAGVALVAGILTTTFAFGRHWCSHLCPVAAPLELGSRLVPRRWKLDFAATPAHQFRYAYLAVYLVAPALGIGSLCCSYCNFAAVPRLFAAPFSPGDLAYFLRFQGVVNAGLLVFLGIFARGGRAYCNLLCPIGALDALSNRLGAGAGRRVRIDAGSCIDCGECSKACPTWAIESKAGRTTINQLSCMPCRQCQGVCPTGAISYGKRAG